MGLLDSNKQYDSMTTQNVSGKLRWLHRGRLRDIVVMFCLVSAFFHPVSGMALWVALLLFGAGCWLHVLVKGQLIRNVTLCTEGAYSVVRHPYYLANYLVDISFCLLSGNVYLVLLYPFLYFWAYGPTFAEEEATLASMHGERFEAYRARVPQVFPTTGFLAGCQSLWQGFSWQRVSTNEIKRIFRFGFLAALLILIRTVGGQGVRELLAGHGPTNRLPYFLLGLCLVCLVFSLLIPGRRKNGDHQRADEDVSRHYPHVG